MTASRTASRSLSRRTPVVRRRSLTARVATRALGAWGAIATIALGAGCRLAARAEGGSYVGPKNACTETCPDGGECIGGRCVKSETNYPYVVEVTPPTAAHYAPNVTFAFPLPANDLALPLATHVIVKSTPPVALAIHLRRIGAIPGEAATAFSARAAGRLGTITGDDGRAEIDVAPGNYDLFVTPAFEDDRKKYPPIAYGTLRLDSSTQVLHVDYAAIFPSLVVDLASSSPSDKPLPLNAGREVSIVDATTGRVVSTVDRTCDEPLHFKRAEVRFARPVGGHTYRLRIAPPTVPCDVGTPPLRPTYDVDLAGLAVEGDNPARTVVVPNDLTPVRGVEGYVHGATKLGPPVTANLLFRITQLAEDRPLGTAFYSVPVSSTGDGHFIFPQILPGTYTVEIVPDLTDTVARPFAVRAQPNVEVLPTAPTLQLQVPPKTRVIGRAVALDTPPSSFTLGDVQAGAVAATAPTVVETSTMLPRSVAATIAVTQDRPNDPSSEHNIATIEAGSGRVTALALDPGRFDFVVRLPEASGYPWIVRSLVDVPAAKEFDLGTMRVTSPVVVNGRVLDPNGDPVPRATVRARAWVCPKAKGVRDCTAPVEAVLVAETRSDERGGYTLMLPSSIEIGSAK